MRYPLLFCSLLLICIAAAGQQPPKAGSYIVPDSVKATGLYTEVIVHKNKGAKKATASLAVDQTILSLQERKGIKSIQFSFPNNGTAITSAPGGTLSGSTYTVAYDWAYDQKYSFLVMQATDSASKKAIYSGYVYVPVINKWKLIGTFSTMSPNTIATFLAVDNQQKEYTISFSNRWLLRSNNSWKALDSQAVKPPVLRPFSNMDSLAQQQAEEKTLNAKLPKDSVIYKEGIFYQLLKEGTDPQVNLTDTVVVQYKGWLHSDGSVFDQTKEKPATFPLSRLIKGWQLAVPHCRVGGLIRIYIPSGLAYGIRTFATTIPPNSTLVFNVEVLEARVK
ncbi:MAG: FKBP-type peptidyl-prolyl cis-trans isomerase [Chitinophagaceae bacterium]|nr:FKBP-type peptidyl-prolyl cis-trans isomerase [Chitinophagaceae bacterium]